MRKIRKYIKKEKIRIKKEKEVYLRKEKKRKEKKRKEN